jgi:hypothetical protein
VKKKRDKTTEQSWINRPREIIAGHGVHEGGACEKVTQERHKELGVQEWGEEMDTGRSKFPFDWRDVCPSFHRGLVAPRACKSVQFKYMGEHFALAMALLEDCLSLLVMLKRGQKAPKYLRLNIHDTPADAFREAVYWLFYEVDPEGERVCSLDWCVGAITAATGVDLRADSLREQAARIGLLPKEYVR